MGVGLSLGDCVAVSVAVGVSVGVGSSDLVGVADSVGVGDSAGFVDVAAAGLDGGIGVAAWERVFVGLGDCAGASLVGASLVGPRWASRSVPPWVIRSATWWAPL